MMQENIDNTQPPQLLASIAAILLEKAMPSSDGQNSGVTIVSSPKKRDVDSVPETEDYHVIGNHVIPDGVIDSLSDRQPPYRSGLIGRRITYLAGTLGMTPTEIEEAAKREGVFKYLVYAPTGTDIRKSPMLQRMVDEHGIEIDPTSRYGTNEPTMENHLRIIQRGNEVRRELASSYAMNPEGNMDQTTMTHAPYEGLEDYISGEEIQLLRFCIRASLEMDIRSYSL